MEMNIQIDAGTKTLNGGDGAGLRLADSDTTRAAAIEAAERRSRG